MSLALSARSRGPTELCFYVVEALFHFLPWSLGSGAELHRSHPCRPRRISASTPRGSTKSVEQMSGLLRLRTDSASTAPHCAYLQWAAPTASSGQGNLNIIEPSHEIDLEEHLVHMLLARLHQVDYKLKFVRRKACIFPRPSGNAAVDNLWKISTLQ